MSWLFENVEALANRYRHEPLRPGWLADDQQWREQLDALSADEAKWLADQWALAGGPDPTVDVSWVTFERRRWA